MGVFMATISAAPVPKGRVLRSPAHNFNVSHKPFVIQPVALAPVLPGETLKSLTIQSRAVLDPVRNPLIGWWLEYYVFYIKHRDLDARDTLTSMMLDQSTDVSSLKQTSARSAPYYTFLGGMKWAELCLKRVVEEWFVDEDQAWDTHTIDGLPIAKINDKNWMDTLIPAADLQAGDTIPSGMGMDELDQSYNQWQYLVAQGLSTMSYEDYLRSFGVRTGRIEQHRPELVRMVRNWSYPSNTVDARAQGVLTSAQNAGYYGRPVSALSWAVAERGDKDRLFTEPGFLLALSVVRPKVYYKNLSGSAAGLMDNLFRWLPALMREDVYTSLITIPDTTGPVPGSTVDYLADLRDLLVHGDQFVNDDMTTNALNDTDRNYVSVPSFDATNTEYASEADIKAMFADIDVAGSPSYTATRFFLRQDGRVQFNILGTQVDHT